ncbi:MAG: phenazine biosynthesis protein [Latescibacteria bacterium DG_63]|nr:MAG: phenazine biosynthesis protein [Latescibacteria bacterium DG_63]
MLTFYIVDVFAEEKYTGNQLAVFTDSASLSDTEMQRIANEMHFSETTFLTSLKVKKGGYDVRIYTPQQELPFAGHPTLGTAYVIAKEIIQEPVESLIVNLKVGQIPVSFRQDREYGEILWMKPNEPTFERILEPESLAEVLGLETTDVDERYPVQEVSTGVPAIMVPLKSLSALKRIQIEMNSYARLGQQADAKIILAFCPETYRSENHLNVRVFAHYYGVPEDPATGAANSCLAGYLTKHHYFAENPADIRVEQGYEIRRPSLLHLKSEERQGRIDVWVGGKVAMVAVGHFV